MFDPTLEDLWKEVERATKETEQVVEPTFDIQRRLAGRWFRREYHEQDPDPENWGYAFMSNMIPLLGMDQPQVTTETTRVIGHKVVSQAMTDGINSWIDDVDYAETLDTIKLDFLKNRSILMHRLEEDARFNRGNVTPAVTRISPHRFFMDSLATSPADAEFMGHWMWMDLDDILADESVPQETRDSLQPGDSDNSTQAERTKDISGSEFGRERIKAYCVWFRRKNTFTVIAEGGPGGILEIYEEKEFYGHPDGPYVLFDAYYMPDEAWPLSPMVAVEDQNRDLNVHARSMGRSAARRKSFVLVEASQTDAGEKITNAEDGEVLPVKGITGNHVTVDIGGVTNDQYTYTEYIRNRLDRISGLTATVQGSVGGANTATEAQIASNGLENRTSYLMRKFMKAVQASLTRIGWLIYNTEGIIIPINRRDTDTGEIFEGLFFGGPSPTDAGATWDDFALKIKPFSMQAENPQERRMRVVEFWQLIAGMMAQAPMMPWIRWANVARSIAEAYGMEDEVDEWVIWEMLGANGAPPQFPPSQIIGQTPVPERNGIAGAPMMMGSYQMSGDAPQPQQEGNPFERATGARVSELNRSGIVNGPQGANPQRSRRQGVA